MGCSKPLNVTVSCPTMCFGCPYFIPDTGSGYYPAITYYTPRMAKFIEQFTNDELLAEIRRRLGT